MSPKSDGVRVKINGLTFASSPAWLTVWRGGLGKQLVDGPLPLSKPIHDEATLTKAAHEWMHGGAADA